MGNSCSVTKGRLSNMDYLGWDVPFCVNCAAFHEGKWVPGIGKTHLVGRFGHSVAAAGCKQQVAGSISSGQKSLTVFRFLNVWTGPEAQHTRVCYQTLVKALLQMTGGESQISSRISYQRHIWWVSSGQQLSFHCCPTLSCGISLAQAKLFFIQHLYSSSWALNL